MTALDVPGPHAPTRAAARGRVAALPWLILALGAVLAALLVLPGQTVVTRALDQLFLAHDGIHRILSGQVPSRDFATATGPLAFLLPAWGHLTSGGYGGALPAALALALVPMTLVAADVLASRLRPGLAVLTAAVLLVTLAAPMHPGEPVTFLSYADLPNRVGWAAVALLLVMVLDPLRDGLGPTIRDAVAAAVLTLLAFYTQASFAVAAVAFLVFVLLVGPRKLWAGAALGGAFVAAAIIELAWGGTRQYLAGVLTAVEAGGWLRARPDLILGHLRLNLTEYLLVGLVSAVALWRAWSPRLVLFLAFCLLARAWLIGQNDPRWNLLAVYAATAVVTEHLLRAMDRRGEPRAAALINPAGVQLFFAALVLPTTVRCASAVALHFGTALAGGGIPLPFPGLEDVRLVSLWTTQDFEGSSEYVDVVADGIAAISATGLEAPRVLVLGAPNAFSSILDLPRPRADMIDARWRGLLGTADQGPAGNLLADVDLVIEPLDVGGPFRDLLRPEIEAKFEVATETAHWRLFRRSSPDASRAVSTSAGRGGGKR